MKKVLTVIISAIAFGIIAGLVMVGINVYSVRSGIVKNNAIVSETQVPTNESTEKEEVTENQNAVRSYSYNTNIYDNIPDLISDVMPTVVSITNMQKFRQNGYSMFGFRV